MPQPTVLIDGRAFDSFEGFVSACNDAFIKDVGGNWSGNLDAFNDYLCWPEHPFKIRWDASRKSRTDLGHKALAAWLRPTLERCDSSSLRSLKKKLRAAQKGEGPTLYDILVEIIDGCEWVTLEEA